MLKIFSKILFFFFLTTLFFSKSFALTCPNFKFEGEWKKGDNDNEIFVLQELLNTDSRTRIADSGPGSRGQETAYFGQATKESLKRFQALFIEYIQIADGNFGERTRVVANKVCKDGFKNANKFTQGEDVNDMYNNPQSSSAPISVTLSTNMNEILSTDSFKVFVALSKSVTNFDSSIFIVEGGNISKVVKLSSTTYSFIVTPDDVATQILVQVEADKLENEDGSKNDAASNEIVVKVNRPTQVGDATTNDTLFDTLKGFLSNYFTNATPTVDCAKVTQVLRSDTQNPCYGKSPFAQENQQNQDQQKDDGQMMQALSGLLGSLMQNLGKGGGAGGGEKAKEEEGAKTDTEKQYEGVCKDKNGKQCKKKKTRVTSETSKVNGKKFDVSDSTLTPGKSYVQKASLVPDGMFYAEKLVCKNGQCQAAPGSRIELVEYKQVMPIQEGLSI